MPAHALPDARPKVAQLIPHCPLGTAEDGCPLSAIYAMSAEERCLWLLAEDEETIDALWDHHRVCFQRRYGDRFGL